MQHFEYLDSYRGLLALSVMTHHLSIDIVHGQVFGVVGFFLLSAFLLTYRIMKQYEAANENIRKIVSITTCYFITRFFRIYVPYAIYSYFEYIVYNKFKLIPGVRTFDLRYYLTLKHMVGPKLESHLWTIPVEIRYYFWIPLISMIGLKCKTKLRLVLCLAVFIILFVIFANNSIYFSGKPLRGFKRNFPIFLLGSFIAIFFQFLENIQIKQKIQTNRLLNGLICWTSIFVLTLGIRLYFWSKIENRYFYGVLFSIFILLMLIGSKNYLTDWLSNSSFLKLFGKYSFGIYLFHMMIIRMTYKVKFLVLTYESDRFIFAILASLSAGYSFFHLIEYPFMSLGIKLSKHIKTLIEKH